MAANTSHVNVFSYSGTSVTTGAYVELVTSMGASCSKMEITDTSTKLLKIASGPAGSEVDICTVAVSGTVIVPVYLPVGTRLSIKAIDATASSGFNVVSFLG